jgi:hypothetical protein
VTTTTEAAPATTSSQQPLPYDREENAFMGRFLWKGGVDVSTGCLAIIDNQVACDCAYRSLRTDGYAASQLAAVGSAVAISNNLPTNAPDWLLHTETVCELQNR